MRIELFPIVVAANQQKQARLRRIRQAEIEARQHLPAWRRWFRRGPAS